MRRCRLLLLGVALLLLLLAPSVRAGHCAAWDGRTYECRGVMGIQAGTLLYIPTQDQHGWTAESYFAQLHNNVILTALYPQTFCRDITLGMLCSTWLRPCVTDEDGHAIAAPHLLCERSCQYLVDECKEIYALYNAPDGAGMYWPIPNEIPQPYNCSSLRDVSLNSSRLYPEETFIAVDFDDESIRVEAQCREFNLTDISVRCNSPLLYNPERKNCEFTCPLPSLTDEEYDAIKILQLVIGWASWAASLFLMVSYLINPNLRQFPSNLVLMTTTAAHIAAWGVILPSFPKGGYHRVWCADDPEFYKVRFATNDNKDSTVDAEVEFYDFLSHHGLCTLQGFLLQYGYQAATFWWATISLNIFLMFYFPNYTQSRKSSVIRQALYHATCWGIPFVLSLVPAVADRVAFAPGTSYCFVSLEDNGAWWWTFWFVPVTLLLLSGVTFYLPSFVHFVRLNIRASKWGKNQWHNFLTYLRLMLFIVIFLIVFLLIFIHTIVVASSPNKVENAYEDYLECLSSSFEKDCKLDDQVANFGLVIVQGIGFAILGLLLFLNFLSWSLLMHYYRVGRLLLQLAKNPRKARTQLYCLLISDTSGSSDTTGSTTQTSTIGSESVMEMMEDTSY